MKVGTRSVDLDVTFRGLWVHDGKLQSEGTEKTSIGESKAWLELDFHEAKQLQEELTRLLPELACPSCDRKGEAPHMEGFVYASGLGRVRLVPALDGVTCSTPSEVDQELVRLMNAGEVPTQLRLKPESMVQVAYCLNVVARLSEK